MKTRLVLSFVLFSCGILDAQQRATVKPIRMEMALKAENIPVISTSGKNTRARHDTAMSSVRNVRAVAKPNPPKPLSAQQVRSLTNPKRPSSGASTNLKAQPKSVINKLKLSPRKNYHGLGYLEMNEVRHIYSKEDAAVFYNATSPFMAYVQAKFKPEKGVRYLMDWSVSVTKKTTFAVGATEITVGEGSHHLLVYLDSETDAWTTIGMSTNTAQYTFYSVEITKVQ